MDTPSDIAMNEEIQPKITSTEVEEYLKENTDFFNHHLDLLERLEIPHPSGNAISLISKQLEIFRNRHHEMENQLTALIEIARDNDTSFNRMHELTLAMLEAATIEEALSNLDQALYDCFLADFVAVRIIRENTDSPIANLFVQPENEILVPFQPILESNQPKCSRPTLLQAKFLFGDSALEVKSCAIIPMMFTELEGLIAIGSRREDRFHHTMGNLFLTQMGEIVGTRLISLLNSGT